MKGVDLSAWQSVGEADWFDPDFVICKATEGFGYVDPNCDGHYQHAKAQGKLLGVYHFARPDLGNRAEDEADWFVDNCTGYLNEAILILDWEPAGQLWNVGWALAWLNRVYARTGVRPLIYMSASVVNGYDWSPVVNGNYGLWIAGYPAEFNVPNPRTPDISEMPFGIGAWPFWAIWQYSSSAGSLDRNVAAMDANAWRLYAGAVTAEEAQGEQSTQPTLGAPENGSSESTDANNSSSSSTSNSQLVKDKQSGKSVSSKNEVADGSDEEQGQSSEPISTDTGLSTAQWLEMVQKGEATVNLVEQTAKTYGLKLTMPSKVYDILKIIAMILLPLSALYMGLANIWGWGFGEEVDATIKLVVSAINAVLGIALVKSSSDYKKGN